MDGGKIPEIPNGTRENSSSTPTLSKEKSRGISPAFRSAIQRAKRSLGIDKPKFAESAKQKDNQDQERVNIGKLIARDKDVSRYGRRMIWSGYFSDYMGSSKEAPALAIQSQFRNPQDFAFRAVSGQELEAIVKGDGIGGPDYKGIANKEGTLFANDVRSGPLSMMDGRTYGGSDDRYMGGYIIVVSKDIVMAHSANAKGLEVVSKIPLEDLHAIFRINIKRPTFKTPDDVEKIYQIAEIVPQQKQ